MGPKKCVHWGVLHVPKKIVDWPMNTTLSKNKKKEVMNKPMNQLI
jgi:hypothetical protein